MDSDKDGKLKESFPALYKEPGSNPRNTHY